MSNRSRPAPLDRRNFVQYFERSRLNVDSIPLHSRLRALAAQAESDDEGEAIDTPDEWGQLFVLLEAEEDRAAGPGGDGNDVIDHLARLAEIEDLVGGLEGRFASELRSDGSHPEMLSFRPAPEPFRQVSIDFNPPRIPGFLGKMMAIFAEFIGIFRGGIDTWAFDRDAKLRQLGRDVWENLTAPERARLKAEFEDSTRDEDDYVAILADYLDNRLSYVDGKPQAALDARDFLQGLMEAAAEDDIEPDLDGIMQTEATSDEVDPDDPGSVVQAAVSSLVAADSRIENGEKRVEEARARGQADVAGRTGTTTTLAASSSITGEGPTIPELSLSWTINTGAARRRRIREAMADREVAAVQQNVLDTRRRVEVEKRRRLVRWAVLQREIDALERARAAAQGQLKEAQRRAEQTTPADGTTTRTPDASLVEPGPGGPPRQGRTTGEGPPSEGDIARIEARIEAIDQQLTSRKATMSVLGRQLGDELREAGGPALEDLDPDAVFRELVLPAGTTGVIPALSASSAEIREGLQNLPAVQAASLRLSKAYLLLQDMVASRQGIDLTIDFTLQGMAISNVVGLVRRLMNNRAYARTLDAHRRTIDRMISDVEVALDTAFRKAQELQVADAADYANEVSLARQIDAKTRELVELQNLSGVPDSVRLERIADAEASLANLQIELAETQTKRALRRLEFEQFTGVT